MVSLSERGISGRHTPLPRDDHGLTFSRIESQCSSATQCINVSLKGVIVISKGDGMVHLHTRQAYTPIPRFYLGNITIRNKKGPISTPVVLQR